MQSLVPGAITVVRLLSWPRIQVLSWAAKGGPPVAAKGGPPVAESPADGAVQAIVLQEATGSSSRDN